MCVYIMAYYKLLKKHYIINIYSYFMYASPCFRSYFFFLLPTPA